MKRFYKAVTVDESEGGFRVLLDGKPIRTPAKAFLLVPTRALADAIAAEWRAQGDEIAPLSMPFLRLADTVIDGVVANREAVIDALLRFGENDQICYRAVQPLDLARLQRESWDPLLAWAHQRFGAALAVTDTALHVEQPPEALAALRTALSPHNAFTLAPLHVVAGITGSVVLALALVEEQTTSARIFALSRLDEDYQAAKWGRDSEAEARAANLARELDTAAAFIAAARGP